MNVFQFKNNGSEPGPAPAAGLVVVGYPKFVGATTYFYSFDEDKTQEIMAALASGRSVVFAYAGDNFDNPNPDPSLTPDIFDVVLYGITAGGGTYQIEDSQKYRYGGVE